MSHTEAYLSGGICGPIWWPNRAICGKPIRVNLKNLFDRYLEPASFQDVLESVLTNEGGDFQSARFTADTEIVFLRKKGISPYKWETRVKIWELVNRPEFSDFVDAEHFTYDFMSEE